MADTFSQRLRAFVIEMPISEVEIAEVIGFTRRTLSRRLKSEGTTFTKVLNEARFKVAKHLLVNTDMRLAEISDALEFSEPAAFTHAFRRWTGTTPSAWRKKHQQVEPLCCAERPDGARVRQRRRLPE
ncbi:AraC family transcriptional regulator [Methylobacterium sp. CB376]|uniref:helix-turn-helix domain-containing protein n=1 Tax=unclassified Methylobacterium TaxID=2615210 RepID=UPI000A001276|nr:MULTISPECIES: AraC family transcriptional regulator [Methylobacterium]WFT82060.1 AraC family transcriptional regulator [Methylobacterium nodulans]